MRSLLTKIAIRKAVGLYLGEHEVVVSKMAATPLGPVVLASSSEPCGPDDVASVIERLLLPLLGRKRRVPVAVAMAASRVYFASRPKANGGVSTPEAELQGALSSSNLCVDDLVVDLLRSTVNKSLVARMAACQRKYVAEVVAILSRLHVRPFLAEPAPCALVRFAERQFRSPRRSKAVLRVFLGAAQGLAVMVSGGIPLGWKAFALAEGSEDFAILSAARALKVQLGHYGIEAALDFAMIHGRPDLHQRLQQEQLPTKIGTRVLWHGGPVMDGAAVASGSALGCLAQDAKAFDLSRTLKARAPIKEIFPWGELTVAAGLICCMGVVLRAHALKLDESCLTVRAENGQHACLATAKPGRLEKDKQDMQKKVEAVRSFLDSRILWSTYTSDIAARMPSNVVLQSFQGKNALNCGGKTRPAPGSFLVQGMAPLLPDGSIPREIDTLLSEIAKNPRWKKDFASVATDIKLPLMVNKDQPKVDFTITCSCKGKGGSSSSKSSSGGDKDKKDKG